MKEIIEAKNIDVLIKNKQIIKHVDLSFKKGQITSIIGPNGSGKTTFLRTISRNIKPKYGKIYLNGSDVFKMKSKSVAQEMAFLSQAQSGLTDVTVRQLVSYGRYAYKTWWQGSAKTDTAIIEWALERTGMKKFAARKVNTLSGGERQCAWIAMAIAQKPKILLLDEPTTFLDICHQFKVLNLLASLNKKNDLTVVMVLHDINQALHYSDEIVVFYEGCVYARGEPWTIINDDIIKRVFNVDAEISCDQKTGKPIFRPVMPTVLV